MFYPKKFWKDYDQIPGVYTPGELALVSSSLFRQHRLRLYRQRISLIGSFLCATYLIVKSCARPVLEFRIGYDLEHLFSQGDKPGQPPVCSIYEQDMKAGRVDKVLARLEPLLQEPGPHDWPDCTYIQVPSSVHGTMAALHMIRTQTDGVWLPTDYGESLGLIDGYLITDQGEPCHTFFVPAECRKELYQALTWFRVCRTEKPRAVIPLEQRLERARHGLPGCNASAAAPVRAFGAMDFKDYMVSCEFSKGFRQQFGEPATFQEAAERVYRFCLDPKNSQAACMDNIAALILPLYSIHNGTAPRNQATKPALDLLRLPFPTVLLGVAVAAEQPRLVWSTRLLLDDILGGEADKLQTTCWEMIRKFDDPDAEAALLFRLLIEPFALMNRAVHAPCY